MIQADYALTRAVNKAVAFYKTGEKPCERPREEKGRKEVNINKFVNSPFLAGSLFGLPLLFGLSHGVLPGPEEGYGPVDGPGDRVVGLDHEVVDSVELPNDGVPGRASMNGVRQGPLRARRRPIQATLGLAEALDEDGADGPRRRP
jgi:hypothetical protein